MYISVWLRNTYVNINQLGFSDNAYHIQVQRLPADCRKIDKLALHEVPTSMFFFIIGRFLKHIIVNLRNWM